MLAWALLFLLAAVLAALLGFTGLFGAVFATAKFVFFIAIMLFALCLAWGLVSGRRPRTR